MRTRESLLLERVLPGGPARSATPSTSAGREVAWSSVGSRPPIVRRRLVVQPSRARLGRSALAAVSPRSARRAPHGDPVRPARYWTLRLIGAAGGDDRRRAGDARAAGGCGAAGERFALLGASSGGLVAAAYAAAHPDRADRLVLYGSYARGRDIAPPSVLDTMLTVVQSPLGLGLAGAVRRVPAGRHCRGASRVRRVPAQVGVGRGGVLVAQGGVRVRRQRDLRARRRPHPRRASPGGSRDPILPWAATWPSASPGQSSSSWPGRIASRGAGDADSSRACRPRVPGGQHRRTSPAAGAPPS